MPTPAEILDFHATHTGSLTRHELKIRDVLGISPVRCVQLLIRAASSMEGQAHDPVTAHRVLRETGRA